MLKPRAVLLQKNAISSSVLGRRGGGATTTGSKIEKTQGKDKICKNVFFVLSIPGG